MRSRSRTGPSTSGCGKGERSDVRNHDPKRNLRRRRDARRDDPGLDHRRERGFRNGARSGDPECNRRHGCDTRSDSPRRNHRLDRLEGDGRRARRRADALDHPAHRHRPGAQQGHHPRRGTARHAPGARRRGRSGARRGLPHRATHEARNRRREPGDPRRGAGDHGDRDRSGRRGRGPVRPLQRLQPEPPGIGLPPGGARGLRGAGDLAWGGVHGAEVRRDPPTGARGLRGDGGLDAAGGLRPARRPGRGLGLL